MDKEKIILVEAKLIARQSKELEKNVKDELEITDLNNQYLEEGQLRWSMLEGYWSDAGSFETLAEVNVYWANKERK